MLSTSVIHSDPDILGGTPVFVGTRVPIITLLDYLEAGDALDEFLDHFPSVSREQAIAALEFSCSAFKCPSLKLCYKDSRLQNESFRCATV